MIGIFIGSFNPPTLAHLEISLKLRDRYQKIIFVPVNSREKKLISIENRINMLLIYKKKYSFIDVSNIMRDYSYLNFRIIDLLKKQYGDIEIIIGSDLFEKINSFDNYDYLLSKYKFMVINRGLNNPSEIVHKKYLNYQEHFTVLNYANEVSSSLARMYIKENKSLNGILDKDVDAYIKKNNLYV